MTKIRNSKYDLEERTEQFARICRSFCRKLPKTISNIEDAKQLIRSSGSVAANYIEANEALSKKDFIHRIKICRKEIKESRLWLRLVYIDNNQLVKKEREKHIQESTELMNIFGAIIRKTE